MAEKCFCHLNGLKVKDPDALHGTDTTLSIAGMAPDAKTVGGRIRSLEKAKNITDGEEYSTNESYDGKTVYAMKHTVRFKNHTFSGFDNAYSEITSIPATAKIVGFDPTVILSVANSDLCKKIPAYYQGEMYLDCEISSLQAVMFPDEHDTYSIFVYGKENAVVSGEIICIVKYIKE